MFDEISPYQLPPEPVSNDLLIIAEVLCDEMFSNGGTHAVINLKSSKSGGLFQVVINPIIDVAMRRIIPISNDDEHST
jgi:hypothetical protein